jgi:protein SCO1/2
VAGGDLGGPFELVDGAGRPVTDADVITEPTLLYFGYTSCPDICPLDVLRNAQAAAILDEQGIPARPVFVTVDPGRDTPEVVGAYAANFAEDAVGLTGTPEQVEAAKRAWRIYSRLGEGGEDYLVDHSTYTYLVLPGEGPEGGFVDIASRDDAPEAVAERMACFAEAAGLA